MTYVVGTVAEMLESQGRRNEQPYSREEQTIHPGDYWP